MLNRVDTKTPPPVFTVNFQNISYVHSTRLTNLNFSKPKLKLTKFKYRILNKGSGNMKGFCRKSIEITPFFKFKMKSKLLISYF